MLPRYSSAFISSLLTSSATIGCAAFLITTINYLFPTLNIGQPYIIAPLLIIIMGPLLYFFAFKPLIERSVQNHAEAAAMNRAHHMLLTVLDSLDAIVYVADIQTYELLFLNRFSRDIFGDGIGKPCWQVLQSDQEGPCEFCSNHKLISTEGEVQGMYAWEFKNTVNNHWYDIRDRAIPWIDGRLVRLEIATDITEKKGAEAEREKLIEKLQHALAEVKTLQGIIPICAYCKNIRDDQGYWNQVEEYLGKHAEVDFSHGICPDCLDKNFPELNKQKESAAAQIRASGSQ